MSKARSAKAKGRRLQNFLRDLLRSAFPSLHEDDIKSQTMGMTGEDIILSPHARQSIPYSFECKNVERLNLWEAINQCETNCSDRTPVVVIKRNRTNAYAVLPVESFIELIKDTNDK
jgi:hypothetical protein|tara:strand:+ start:22951 stop:23301 length:351 start_codon:yes stop_codon:yes gene_type:complete